MARDPKISTPRNLLCLIFHWCFKHFSYQFIIFILCRLPFCHFSKLASRHGNLKLYLTWYSSAYRSTLQSRPWLLIFLHLFPFISTSSQQMMEEHSSDILGYFDKPWASFTLRYAQDGCCKNENLERIYFITFSAFFLYSVE